MTVAIGFFDGVHLGHQAILKDADVALTFENHPLSLLKSEKAPRLIMSLEDRLAAIRACGVKRVEALKFDAELAALSPEEFLELLKAFANTLSNPFSIRCADNWRFGKGGVGDAAWLTARGIPVAVVPYAEYRGEPISSTRIRAALEAGAIEDANAMLGRAYTISGEIFSGKGKGKTLGYPTVNIRPTIESMVPKGVYEVEIAGVKAIANYGFAPTFDANAWSEPVWEIHFLTSRTSRTSQISQTFSLLRFIRGERKFASLEDLKRQIALDCATIGA